MYRKYGDRDIVAMTRSQMQGVTHEFDVSDLKGKNRKELAMGSKDVLNNEAFQTAINNVKVRVLVHIRDKAQSAEQIFYDRFTINGIELLKEELEDYAFLHEEDVGNFDKYALL